MLQTRDTVKEEVYEELKSSGWIKYTPSIFKANIEANQEIYEI